jgi:hypothetical protein
VRWAVALLGEAMKRLRCEYPTPKKGETLEVLKAFLDLDNSKAAPRTRKRQRGCRSAWGR